MLAFRRSTLPCWAIVVKTMKRWLGAMRSFIFMLRDFGGSASLASVRMTHRRAFPSTLLPHPQDQGLATKSSCIKPYASGSGKTGTSANHNERAVSPLPLSPSTPRAQSVPQPPHTPSATRADAARRQATAHGQAFPTLIEGAEKLTPATPVASPTFQNGATP
jgi:hypothetical protein